MDGSGCWCASEGTGLIQDLDFPIKLGLIKIDEGWDFVHPFNPS
jgi:uncharacterized protein YlaN (UPF0358 family)